MAISCIIVEDEKMARKSLERLCGKIEDIRVVATCESALEAMDVLKKQEVALILLDVEMPDINGWEMLNQLEKRPLVVFTTGKKDYAVQAFEEEAVDFLVKPITLARLLQAIRRVKERVKESKEADSERFPDSIFVRSERRYVRIEVEDIQFIETKGDYVMFRTDKENLLVHATLKSMEQQLDPSRFVKVHRSFIVNISRIVDIEEGTLVIGDKVIPISRSQRPVLMKKIQVIQ